MKRIKNNVWKIKYDVKLAIVISIHKVTHAAYVLWHQIFYIIFGIC